MWILGAQGLRVSSYMPQVVPPEAHRPKKGGGGSSWEVFRIIRRLLEFQCFGLLCVLAINEGMPSGFWQGGASDCCRRVFSFGALRIVTGQAFERQWFCGQYQRHVRYMPEVVPRKCHWRHVRYMPKSTT